MSKKLESKAVNELTYEEAFNELVALVEALESDEHPLDETMVLFEKGQALSRRCATLLDQAELKVLQLSGEKLIEMGVE
jgi:exodeoxyribonuclease VII small subunit